MPVRHRLVLFSIVLSLLPSVARADEAENWRRLSVMPRERRLALGERLKQFDALDHAERSAIRKLDAQIAELPPAEQARYRATLRRYHLWVQGLSGDQKEQLKRSQPGRDRMVLVGKLHKAQQTKLASGRGTPLSIRLIPFTPRAPVEFARVLKAWLSLPPSERAAIEKGNLSPDAFVARVRRGSEGVFDQSKPFRSYPDADQDVLHRNLDAELKKSGEPIGWFKAKMDAGKDGFSEKSGEKAAGVATEKAAANAARFKHHIVENYYFLKHPPKSVSPENLLRFDAALPNIMRTGLDILPADEARVRLTVLYRLVYPEGEEMPMPKPPAPVAKPAAPKPKLSGATPPAAATPKKAVAPPVTPPTNASPL